jgi:putative transposase
MHIRQPYPTDLSDAEWDYIRHFFPVRPKGLVGRPREIAYRDLVDAILYLSTPA